MSPAAPEGRTGPETVRKLLHAAFGLGAFTLRPLGPGGGAALAAAALAFNVALLPRLGGRRLWRPAERAAGRSAGMILYPAAVLVLVVAFARRPEVAAAVWGILAFGDGAATLAGRGLAGRPLPWNARKTWWGTLAYAVCGTAAAWALLLWTAPGRCPPGFALAAAATTALVAAAVESLPLRLDDNLTVPPVAGLFLLGVLAGAGRWGALLASPELAARATAGAAVNLALAVAGVAARALSPGGAAAGVLLGTVVWAGLGAPGYVLLVVFFVLASAATRLGYARKRVAGLAQEAGGRRGARHAVANAGVAAACAAFAAASPAPAVWILACAGALATAAADTVASEIGQLWGRRTVLPTTLARVPPGTPGAVSVEGTAAGLAAALAVAAAGAATGLFGWTALPVLVAAAFVGTAVESVLGATVERRGLLGNEAMNFLNTLVGALCAAWLGSR